MSNGFDRLAKPYRWMEYLSFGRALERCRFCFLPRLTLATNAVLLGDGDGRFAERLLHAAPNVRITAVDASSAMLELLRMRCAQPDRVATRCLNVVTESLDPLKGGCFDLIVSHFFLDCLSTSQVEALARQLNPMFAPRGRWIVSEFQIPTGAMRLPALLIVRLLYAAFRVLAGLRVQRLPDHRRALEQAGLSCTTQVRFLHGLLIAEEWQRQPELSASGLK